MTVKNIEHSEHENRQSLFRELLDIGNATNDVRESLLIPPLAIGEFTKQLAKEIVGVGQNSLETTRLWEV